MADNDGGKVTEIRPRDQGKLAGVQPKHMQRLEEIEDSIERNKEKISKLREENADLKAEAVALFEKHEIEGTHIRGSNEWYVDQPEKTYKCRRHKIDKEKTAKKAKKASA